MSSLIDDLYAPWGTFARQQLNVMPEGAITDDGAGNVNFSGTLLIWAGNNTDNWIRVASGSYALGSWDALVVQLPPTSTPRTTVTPVIAAYTGVAADSPWPDRDRLVLGHRVATGRVAWRSASMQVAANPVTIPRVVTLPGSPVDGQEVILVDSLTVPTYAWRLRFATAPTPDIWEFVGGSDKIVKVSYGTYEQIGSAGSWQNLATTGPDFTIPATGTYQVRWGAKFNIGDANNKDLYMGLTVGNTNPPEPTAEFFNSANVAMIASETMQDERAFTVGDIARCRYYTSAVGSNAPSWMNRYLSIRPLKIG